MKKAFIGVLILIAFNQAHATSEEFATFFRIMDEVQKIEQDLLHKAPKTVGPLSHMFICISSQVSTGMLAQVVNDEFSVTLRESLKSLPAGQFIIDQVLNENPNLLNLDIKLRPYSEECKAKIDAVYSNQNIPHEVAQKVVILSEAGGTELGNNLTQFEKK